MTTETDLPRESIESLREQIDSLNDECRRLKHAYRLAHIDAVVNANTAGEYEGAIERVRAVADSILREAASFGIRAIAETFLAALDSQQGTE